MRATCRSTASGNWVITRKSNRRKASSTGSAQRSQLPGPAARSGACIRVGYSVSGSAPGASNPNPTFVGRDILEWWSWAGNAANVVARPAGPLFSVTSGAFFVGSYSGNPIQQLAYPLKNRGNLVSIGNDTTNAPLREFRLTDTAADIVYLATNPREWSRTNAALGPFTSVVGFHPGNQGIL